jgi:bifunctional DNA-binding transcriptional regulator/antitoxin component of YhaV-PrlF toxin-antitoxin module
MLTLTVTAKGQVTLNKDVLRHLRIGPGDKINVDLKPNGEASIAKQPAASWDDIAGMLHDPDGPTLTLEEIKTVIEEGWADSR